MGKRDYRRREPKKPKKSAKMVSVTDILPPSITVDVVKKKKKKEPEEEELEPFQER